jgi:ubiquinone/menaquinone biosynthesis C-methylase UbiE
MKDEIEIQDLVSDNYEECRYQIWYSYLYHRHWTANMLSLCNTSGRILDNGCGTGILFELLPDADIVGLDISGGMIEKAKRRSTKVVLGDSQTLPFRDGKFDLIFNRSLLHHVPDPQKAISEMARVLRPKGEAVFVETNKSLISTVPRKLAGRTDHFSDEHKNFSRHELIDMLSSEFEIRKVTYFGYIAYPLLGFPDLIDVFRYFPAKRIFVKLLILADNMISMIPLINTQSWGILIHGVKK